MAKESRWTVDVKSLSTQRLVEISLQLGGSEHEEVVESLRRELIERLRAMGKTPQEIVRHIAMNVPRGRRFNEMAKAWAEIIGISVAEFKRIADLK